MIGYFSCLCQSSHRRQKEKVLLLSSRVIYLLSGPPIQSVQMQSRTFKHYEHINKEKCHFSKHHLN
uniref:Uncharacterized protein n=1 Tax=Musa acuminata subsp. malaccensis TaxID=214687 RepID=A0A804K2D4_MUSAM